MFWKRPVPLATLTLVLITSLALTGCRREPAVEQGTETATWITGELREPIPEAEVGKTVVVTVSEASIGIPLTLNPGPMVFTISNGGVQPIGFRIQGGEIDLALDVPIQPGETSSLNADLPSGTYIVSAPIDNVPETGPTLEVTVEL